MSEFYNCSRDLIEHYGRRGARQISETASTRVVRVLDAFDIRVLKEDASVAPHLLQDGFWESWITSWFTKWVRPGMTVLDVGANCGYYTLLFEKLVGKYGTVIAYEPNPIYVELLRSTRDLNNANFKIREVALSDNLGSATLTVPGTLHGSASIMGKFPEYKAVEYEVRTTTLDREVMNLTFFRHDIIKMDAEGAEELIWNGGRRLWEDVSTHTTLVIEFTPGAYSKEFIDELLAWGNITRIGHDGEELYVDKDYLLSLTNWDMIVVRKR